MASFLGELQLGVEQPVPAEIFFEPRGLRAVALSGAIHRIRYQDLVVDVEPRDGTVIARSTKDGASVSCNQSGFLEAIRKAGIGLDDHVLATVAEGKGRRRGMIWFAAFIGASVGLIVLLLLLPSLAVLTVDYLPRSLDRRLGEATDKEVQLGAPIEDPAVQAVMDGIIDRLKPYVDARDFEFHVRVVDTDLLNAFAMPGGTILVTTGLIECADSPEQVAGVLSHEMAHVTLRHGLRSFMRGAGFMVMVRLLFGDEDSVAGIVAQGAAVTVILGHSREHESAADMEGLRTMHESGLDGSTLREMLLKMEAREGAPAQETPEWASTHPNTTSRCEAIDLALSQMDARPTTPLAVNWAAAINALRNRKREIKR